MGAVKRTVEALSAGGWKKVLLALAIAIVPLAVGGGIAFNTRVGKAEEANTRQDRDIERLKDARDSMPDQIQQAVQKAVGDLKADMNNRFNREAELSSERHQEILNRLRDLTPK